jgi:hypothetical protein
MPRQGGVMAGLGAGMHCLCPRRPRGGGTLASESRLCLHAPLCGLLLLLLLGSRRHAAAAAAHAPLARHDLCHAPLPDGGELGVLLRSRARGMQGRRLRC